LFAGFIKIPVLWLAVLFCGMAPTLDLNAAGTPVGQHIFAIGANDFLLDGRPFQIRCGEIHGARVPREYWRNRLQMARAMGLNTVCAYLFWNQVEPEPGRFDWSGRADIGEFCKIAQEEGLWVILRPGPYACAEWDEGGLPWWLLKYDGIQLRSRDPRFFDAAREYLGEVGKQLAALQITHGGPILMVQVENEYGFFNKDKDYLGGLRQTLVDAGFDVPLFCCDPPGVLRDGWRPDLFPVVNFGSDPAGAFKALREILPQGPLMCGEFYPGWFDTWGAPHHRGNTQQYLSDLEYMLSHNDSFSIYMAHGGTTFGLWAGCDRPFKPDTSSYDYDAPISEAGWPTPKFFQTRELFAKYLLPGETLPALPAQNPVTSFAAVELNEVAPLLGNLPSATKDKTPRSMEAYDQGYGCILYRTRISAGPAGLLAAAAIHDFGYVFLDGRRVGILDRRISGAKIPLPERKHSAQLDILVEPMGRVNFGPEMADHKGLIAPVKFAGTELHGWKVFKLPLDNRMLAGLEFSGQPSAARMPAFWRGTFRLDKAADTFLDLHHWGKGDLWVNGHCLGRYWNIGPTQTAYAPGCWLHDGTNEVVILDLLGPEKPEISGSETPILDELHPEKDFAQTRRPPVTLHLNSAAPTLAAQFTPGAGTQVVQFAAPATGRYFCLESLSAWDGKPSAAVAELDLLDAHGKPISHDGWTIAYVDSEERTAEDGTAENAIDGQTANYWHTEWKATRPGHPHQLVLDLAKSQSISGFRYVPRQSEGAGRIKDYRIFVGDHLIEQKEPLE
jgi:beta-galactosidase